MKLFSIHCGFYDEEISEGIYEFHVNLPVVAENIEQAKAEVRLNPVFKMKKMHVDGIQEITRVGGYELILKENRNSETTTKITNHLHRDF